MMIVLVGRCVYVYGRVEHRTCADQLHSGVPLSDQTCFLLRGRPGSDDETAMSRLGFTYCFSCVSFAIRITGRKTADKLID